MNQLTHTEFERIVSLYLDGELDAVETRKLEEYLVTHPAAAREVEILRTAKKSLASKPPLSANHWFWLKLSNRLESQPVSRSGLFLSRRPAVAVSMLALFSLIVTSVIYVKDAPMFHQYFVEKKNQVEQAYRNNIMTGSILPLFANLNKDDVLNFALFGNIAIDSSQSTALQVRNSEDRGSQIQIVKNQENAPPGVTVNDFAYELGISELQREVVDSILGSYKEKLQASVLVSENDEVAIHAELVDLNRAMVSTIAACLEPPQRTKFKRFLDVRKAPYAVVAVNSPTVPSHVLLNKIPEVSAGTQYVVISSDTVEFATVSINVDSIREIARRHEMRFQRAITERMVAELIERRRAVEERIFDAGRHKVRVHSTGGAFQIHFEHDAPVAAPDMEMIDMVKPRMRVPVPTFPHRNRVTVIGDSAVMFEIPADDRALRIFRNTTQGESHFEMIDSILHEPKMKLMFKSDRKRGERDSRLRERQRQDEELLDLDSLLRESEAMEAPLPAKPRKPGRELEIVM